MASMSYCMFENTSNEMNQLLGAMDEVSNISDLNLNNYERIAYRNLLTQCEAFLEEAARLGQES